MASAFRLRLPSPLASTTTTGYPAVSAPCISRRAVVVLPDPVLPSTVTWRARLVGSVRSKALLLVLSMPSVSAPSECVMATTPPFGEIRAAKAFWYASFSLVSRMTAWLSRPVRTFSSQSNARSQRGPASASSTRVLPIDATDGWNDQDGGQDAMAEVAARRSGQTQMAYERRWNASPAIARAAIHLSHAERPRHRNVVAAIPAPMSKPG